MPEVVKSAHTTRTNEVFILVEESADWWMIKNTALNVNSGRSIMAAGDKQYVQRTWNDFVADDRALASQFNPATGKFGLR